VTPTGGFSTPRDAKRLAVAFGSGITLLGVVRTLSEAGAEVVVAPDAEKMVRRSRHFRAGPDKLLGVRPETLAEALTCLPHQTVLFPCSDLWVRTIAGLPDAIRRDYPASVSSPATLDLLVDKALFRSKLEALGLPHPTTRTLTATRISMTCPTTFYPRRF
jgi:hypothetical protein